MKKLDIGKNNICYVTPLNGRSRRRLQENVNIQKPAPLRCMSPPLKDTLKLWGKIRDGHEKKRLNYLAKQHFEKSVSFVKSLIQNRHAICQVKTNF